MADKGKYNKLSQAAYEKKMQGFADSLKRENERLTKKRSQAWLGEPKDFPSPTVQEVAIPKKGGRK
jgi:hypothetical protein